MLTSAQFRIVAPLENGLVVSSPSAVAPSGIFLWECNSGRCAGVRIESRFPVGDRHAAHQAIHSFDRSVPIAKVSFTEEQQGTFLHIGRDVWLAPGRSAENLLLQVRHVEKLTNSMIQHLLSRDPGIRDYWQSLTENRE
jgi:hypothetical protein